MAKYFMGVMGVGSLCTYACSILQLSCEQELLKSWGADIMCAVRAIQSSGGWDYFGLLLSMCSTDWCALALSSGYCTIKGFLDAFSVSISLFQCRHASSETCCIVAW